VRDGPTTKGRTLVVVAVVTLALNLRPVANAMGAVMPELIRSTGLSGAASGVLLALPTLAFGLLGSAAPSIARRLGTHRTVLLALVALLIGQLVRAIVPTITALFAGSLLALAGIACANVLLPGLVRLHFPDRIGPMTAVYTTLMAVGAATASGITLPVSRALGGDWRLGLGMWAAFAAVAVWPWAVLAVRSGPPPAGAASAPRIRLGAVARTRLGWAMALYFGLQALQAYVMFGWLPTILADAGVPDTAAALQVAIIAAVGVPISAVTPTLVGRYPAPRLLIIVLTACYLAGYLGVLWAPTTLTWLWSVLIGIGGGAFPVALTLIAMRARTPAGTITLSAFAQSAGYLVASIGPVLIGALHDWTGGWRVPLICLCGVLALHLLAGLAAARPRYVEDELPATTGPPAG
jgi:CP family cyanate transporter-like MFS transporter